MTAGRSSLSIPSILKRARALVLLGRVASALPSHLLLLESFAKEAITKSSQNLCMDGHLAPELLVLGAQKAATTSLSAELPDIKLPPLPKLYQHFMPDGINGMKEVHVFDDEEEVNKGKANWLSKYPECITDERAVAGDFTPSYLCEEEAPARIKAWYGKQASKIYFVALLREPLARTHSSFYYTRLNMCGHSPNAPPTKKLKRRISKSTPTFWLCEMSFQEYAEVIVEDPECDDCLHRKDPFHKSIYAEALLSYFKIFDSNQFLIVPYKYEVIRDEEEPSVADYIHEHLGLPTIHMPKVPFINEGKPHASLDDDLPPDSELRTQVQSLHDLRTGANVTAALLGERQADLYRYEGDRHDAAAIAEWLSVNW